MSWLQNATQAVGNVVAPKIEQPTYNGQPLGPAPSPVDRWIPLLSGVGASLAHSEDVPGMVGNLFGGFARGRQAQQYLAQQMYAPYYSALAEQQMAQQARAQQREALQDLAQRYPKFADRLGVVGGAIGAGIPMKTTPDTLLGTLPRPPRQYQDFERRQIEQNTETLEAQEELARAKAKNPGMLTGGKKTPEERAVERKDKLLQELLRDMDNAYKAESTIGGLQGAITRDEWLTNAVKQRWLARARAKGIHQEALSAISPTLPSGARVIK